ncbi:MAG: amidohydrolase family protein, partial [Kiritimatiellae bacterium]|nr:amidohydrolase family protein [Kiritimatiellia bacterium]
AGNTDLDVILPAWAQEGGRDAVLRRLRDPEERARLRQDMAAVRSADDWKGVVIGSTAEASFRGRPLPEVAHALGVDAIEAALRLMEGDELKTSAFFFGMSEDNMWKILAEPYIMLGSDASLRSTKGPLSRDFPHPRAYGAFPRFLRAALDGKTVSLPEAIRKMTSLPADHFRLKGRGRVVAGTYADLVVFDPNTVTDVATYAVPHALTQGIECVMVNGIPTLDRNGLTGRRAGRIL